MSIRHTTQRGVVAFVLSSVALAAVAQRGNLPATTNAQPATQATAAQSPDYRLGPGDTVRVSVFQSPELGLDTRISESGFMSYPLLGQVKVGGLTISEAEKKIADGLRSGNFVRQPQVSLLVLQVRGNQASVLGQVNKPGRYPLEVADMRLTDLLAAAGGVAPTGAEVVTLVGVRGGQPYRVQVNLSEVFAPGQRSTQDIRVTDGDVVWVDRAPTVYIYGEVQRPGPVRLERGMTLMQVLAAGGGLTQRGTQRGLKVHRKAEDGKVQVVQPSMDEPLREGDVVYVRESIF